ncbi:MAG: 50S ribosomal protein L25 [Ignavibacteria bacterium]|nr:50S ribosomal protein L25 [Ignavibacteria bacterium]
MAEIALNGVRREVKSQGHINELRRQGFIPAVFYKHGEGNKLLAVNELKIRSLIFSAETHLINLSIDDSKPEACIIKEFQLDPLTEKILHVDFHGLKAGEKITIDVTLHLIGSAQGVKDGGVIQHSMHKLHLECLPSQIPDKIDVDISSLKIGDSIHVRDLNIPNIKILSNMGSTVVAVVPPTVQKEAAEVETIEEEAAEPEVISKGKKTEEE